MESAQTTKLKDPEMTIILEKTMKMKAQWGSGVSKVSLNHRMTMGPTLNIIT